MFLFLINEKLEAIEIKHSILKTGSYPTQACISYDQKLQFRIAITNSIVVTAIVVHLPCPCLRYCLQQAMAGFQSLFGCIHIGSYVINASCHLWNVTLTTCSLQAHEFLIDEVHTFPLICLLSEGIISTSSDRTLVINSMRIGYCKYTFKRLRLNCLMLLLPCQTRISNSSMANGL